MTAKRLVFVHGRAQENKDSIALKAEWVDAWKKGLGASSLALPLTDETMRFPYYGQTLYDMVSGKASVAEVVVRGNNTGTMTPEQAFQHAVVVEVQKELDISDDEVEQMLAPAVRERGPANWEWVQAILKAVDQHVPGASSLSIALATRDVYQYLKSPGISKKIEDGVISAMVPGVPTVVVSHSLGTVVAYNVIKREGAARGWKIPLFVTLGSPLAVKAIKHAIAPIEFPACVGQWFNAMDERDVVSLYPLEAERFDVSPGQIENKTDVNNHTENRHGISGYLDDPVVARRIHAAITG